MVVVVVPVLLLHFLVSLPPVQAFLVPLGKKNRWKLPPPHRLTPVVSLHQQDNGRSDESSATERKQSTAWTVGIVGAGAIAWATAALLAQAGHTPMLWSPSSSSSVGTEQPRKKTQPLKRTSVGPSSNHRRDTRVTVKGQPDIGFSTPPHMAQSVAELVQQNQIIMLCLPANGHKYVMDEIVPFLSNGQSVIISSHASFGALYLSQQLHLAHQQQQQRQQQQQGPTMNTIPITAWGTTVATARLGTDSHDGARVVRINTIRNAIDMTTIPASCTSQAQRLCQQLFPQISNFVLRDGLVGIALSNLNPQNHLGIALGNISRMEKGEDWYQSLHITPAIGRLLEDLDAERLAIADCCQVKVKTIFEHFSLSFHVPLTTDTITISEMNQQIHALGNDVLGPNTADSRYILEDVPFGLVPTIVLGRMVGKPALLHEAGVRLISSMCGRDFMTENNLLQALQLDELYTLQDLQRAGETGVLLHQSPDFSPIEPVAR